MKDTLDLDLSMRTLTRETAQDAASDLCGNSRARGDGLDKHDTLGSVSCTVNILCERSQEGGEEEEHSLGQHSEGCRGSSRGATANRASICRNTCQDDNTILKTIPDHADPRTHDVNVRDLTNGVDQRGRSNLEQHQHQSQSSHHPLVPARLVAVLIDGAGRGWMAARRLWSVREVGMHALAEAGLASADVDQEQEVSDMRIRGFCDRGDGGLQHPPVSIR